MYPQYVLIRAARFLGCTPWELEQQPAYWRDWALTCEKVDAQVEAAIADRHRRDKGRNR